MAEILQKLVVNLQAEISNLRAQVIPGRLTAQKDLFQFPLNPSGQGQKSPLV
jgi:hypothetical protein